MRIPEMNNYLAPIAVQELASSGELLFLVNALWRPFLEESGLSDFDAIWQCQLGEVVKERAGLEIRRLEVVALEKDSDPVVLYIKKHEQPAGRCQESEGLKEFSNYCAFRRRGLATAVPVAAGMARQGGGVVRSFLVTRDFAPLVDLEELVLNRPESLMGVEKGPRKKNILRAVARYARAMDRSGCNQKDFTATHVLLQGLDDPEPLVALFDLQRVDTNRLFAFRWPIKALAEFFFTLPAALFDEEDRLFFFTAYKGSTELSPYGRLQYGCILRKMARIARHSRKRNLAPKMRE
jgi:hypothetical protein